MKALEWYTCTGLNLISTTREQRTLTRKTAPNHDHMHMELASNVGNKAIKQGARGNDSIDGWTEEITCTEAGPCTVATFGSISEENEDFLGCLFFPKTLYDLPRTRRKTPTSHS